MREVFGSVAAAKYLVINYSPSMSNEDRLVFGKVCKPSKRRKKKINFQKKGKMVKILKRKESKTG